MPACLNRYESQITEDWRSFKMVLRVAVAGGDSVASLPLQAI